MTKVRICVAGRNHEAFTEGCIRSIAHEVTPMAGKAEIFVDWTDDCSDTIEAYQLARSMLGVFGDSNEAPHARVERTRYRRGGLENLWRAFGRAGDDAILVPMGGDDELKPGAIDRILREYADPECWATYGQLENTLGPAYHRAYEWKAGTDPRAQQFLWAPLTVRAKLAKKVLEEDLKLDGGWFFPSSGDVALNIPIVEMAGHDRCRFIPDAWYSRRIHAGNDHNVNRRLQDFCSWTALAKPRYARLASMDDAPVRTPHELEGAVLFSSRFPHGSFVAF